MNQLLTPSQLLALLQVKLGLISLGAFVVLLMVGWMIWQSRGAAYAKTRLKCPYFELTHETKNAISKAKSSTRSPRKSKRPQSD